jgi:hypothetical protein
MALDIGDSIGNWDSTRLTRFIKEFFEKDPPAAIGQTAIDNLTIQELLTVRDQISFARDPNYHRVGLVGEPTFQNSWTNTGSPWGAAAFWKDPLGFVHLRGNLSSGTLGATSFTLPAGSRPDVQQIFVIDANGAFGRVTVQMDGQVVMTTASATRTSIDGIHFKAA